MNAESLIKIFLIGMFNVTNMISMFENAIIFNQNISNWNIENVNDWTNLVLVQHL